jgi:ribosome-binding ATPase YchF (GTP1/OBG family)
MIRGIILEFQLTKKSKNTMKNYLLITLILSMMSCANPTQTRNQKIIETYQSQYNEMKERVIRHSAKLEMMLEQLPGNYAQQMDKSIQSIKNNDLEGFLTENRMSEQNLMLFFQSVDGVCTKIEMAEQFTPNEEQRAMYAELRGKVQESREIVQKFISANANTTDPNQLALKLTLEKILKYDVDGFLANTLTSSAEFDKNLGETNDKWGEVILGLTMMNFNEEMDEIMKK